MAKYNVHAGHNYKVPGASGILSETKEARVIAQKVKPLLMREILFGQLKQGGSITIDYNEADACLSIG